MPHQPGAFARRSTRRAIACIRRGGFVFSLVAVSLLAARRAAADGFALQRLDDRLRVTHNGRLVADFLTEHARLTRRGLVNVHTLGGRRVTRRFPAQLPDDRTLGFTGEGGIDHPWMHPGIWLGFGDVDGNDYWRMAARVVHDGFEQPPVAEGDTARFVARGRMLTEDGQSVVCVETLDHEFTAREGVLYLVLRARYASDEHDFYFGDQEESGLGLRVDSRLRVEGGSGEMVNSAGQRNGADAWGREAEWIDYSAVLDGRRVGVMITPSPANPRRCWMHTRDYGLIVANPFPRQPRERREPYVKTWVHRGQPLTLTYALAIHDAPAESAPAREALYEESLRRMRP